MKKILKNRRRLENKKGMTIVELIAGMLVLAIIAVSATTVLVSTTRAYTRATSLAEINTLFDSLSKEMLSELSRASGITVSGTALEIRTNVNTIVYDIGVGGNSGLLCRSSDYDTDNYFPVLDRQYYKDKELRLKYYTSGGALDANEITDRTTHQALIVRLELLTDSNVIASRDYAVMPLGLNQYSR